MKANIVHLYPQGRPARSPARFYNFVGDPDQALNDDAFLDKAAAFQEIRATLVAADTAALPPHEAERKIGFLVRMYLGLQRGGSKSASAR